MLNERASRAAYSRLSFLSSVLNSYNRPIHEYIYLGQVIALNKGHGNDSYNDRDQVFKNTGRMKSTLGSGLTRQVSNECIMLVWRTVSKQ